MHLSGVPLPLLGLIAYGFVTTLSLQLSAKNLPFGINEMTGRLLLLGSSTSMATASAYFLYILTTKFAGTSCSYCLASALLSFSLFFISLKVSINMLDEIAFAGFMLITWYTRIFRSIVGCWVTGDTESGGFTSMHSKLGICHVKYIIQQFTICSFKVSGCTLLIASLLLFGWISFFHLSFIFNSFSIDMAVILISPFYLCLHSQANIDLPYFTTEITKESSPFALSLARHLHSIGAKMYGAFWCSHCLEQKEVPFLLLVLS